MPKPYPVSDIRPRTVVLNFNQGPVQFVDPRPQKPAGPPPSLLIRIANSVVRLFRRPERPVVSIAPTMEALGIGADGMPLADGIQTFSDAEFADYVDLLVEVARLAVPRDHRREDVPRRQACVDNMIADPRLKELHARAMWTWRGLVVLYFAAGTGNQLLPWALKYHSETTIPTVCRAVEDDVMVIVPRVVRRTQELKRALRDAMGQRYRF